MALFRFFKRGQVKNANTLPQTGVGWIWPDLRPLAASEGMTNRNLIADQAVIDLLSGDFVRDRVLAGEGSPHRRTQIGGEFQGVTGAVFLPGEHVAGDLPR